MDSTDGRPSSPVAPPTVRGLTDEIEWSRRTAGRERTAPADPIANAIASIRRDVVSFASCNELTVGVIAVFPVRDGL
ncbi:hypothetical protein EA472_08385 [Natrarchaeobius oligotrophus]|uniref:Uncharacterized protein n=1 Tax=Natrarchaeobius chitinivorans TaxID=1679083 RepID=A0A3N6PQA4_NATCH|nr:hypothetical protein EA472_08385 [Natrarchaeobius chitinivorans]